MAAVTAGPRTGRTHRRRSRYDTPAWADKYPATPEGLDAQQTEAEARALPEDTDPDSITDPDVRAKFLELAHADEPSSPRGGAGGRGSGGRAPGRSERRSRDGGRGRARFSHPLHWGTGARYAPKLGRPTLRAPSRLSVSDGSGFMLGLLGYALAMNYLRHGWPGVTGWISAKFVNKPMGGGAADSAAMTPAVPPPPGTPSVALTPRLPAPGPAPAPILPAPMPGPEPTP